MKLNSIFAVIGLALGGFSGCLYASPEGELHFDPVNGLCNISGETIDRMDDRVSSAVYLPDNRSVVAAKGGELIWIGLPVSGGLQRASIGSTICDLQALDKDRVVASVEGGVVVAQPTTSGSLDLREFPTHPKLVRSKVIGWSEAEQLLVTWGLPVGIVAVSPERGVQWVSSPTGRNRVELIAGFVVDQDKLLLVWRSGYVETVSMAGERISEAVLPGEPVGAVFIEHDNKSVVLALCRRSSGSMLAEISIEPMSVTTRLNFPDRAEEGPVVAKKAREGFVYAIRFQNAQVLLFSRDYKVLAESHPGGCRFLPRYLGADKFRSVGTRGEIWSSENAK